MSQKGTRKKWAAAEKLRIVLAGMQPNVEVSELCRREGINPTQYYGWKKQLLSSATKVFDERDGKRSAAEEKKEAELRRMKDVVAEITAENLELKKGALGLEDDGQLPPGLQKRVYEEVEQARRRSGWPAKKTLAALGIPRRTYYRWLQEEAWARVLPAEPVRPVQP